MFCLQISISLLLIESLLFVSLLLESGIPFAKGGVPCRPSGTTTLESKPWGLPGGMPDSPNGSVASRLHTLGERGRERPSADGPKALWQPAPDTLGAVDIEVKDVEDKVDEDHSFVRFAMIMPIARRIIFPLSRFISGVSSICCQDEHLGTQAHSV